MLRSDLSPPPEEPNDAHGNRPKVYRITVTFGSGTSTGPGSATMTVNWE